jgi:hypothetical protein
MIRDWSLHEPVWRISLPKVHQIKRTPAIADRHAGRGCTFSTAGTGRAIDDMSEHSHCGRLASVMADWHQFKRRASGWGESLDILRSLRGMLLNLAKQAPLRRGFVF